MQDGRARWPGVERWAGPVGCPPQVSGPGREGEAPGRRAVQQKCHMGPSWHHGRVLGPREEWEAQAPGG